MRRLVVLLVVLVVLEAPAAWSASPAPASSPYASAFTLPIATSYSWTSGPALESIRYRPRRRPRDRDRDRDYEESRSSRSRGFSQLHGGFFDPDGTPERGLLLGLRAGTSIEEKIQIGLGIDWNHRSDRQTALIREVPTPGGGTAQQSVIQSESSSNLFPMMAVLQVSPAVDSPVLPYFGVGGGYQVLFLNARDFSTNQEFDATYGGWAWQAWGGLGFPLSGRTRLNAEVFLTGGNVERDVDDPTFGTVREIIDMDGAGMRAGLAWGF